MGPLAFGRLNRLYVSVPGGEHLFTSPFPRLQPALAGTFTRVEDRMPSPTNDELLERWKDEPAPLLPLLHEFHTRDGFLSEDALRIVSGALRIPIADLFGTVTFYHHFARQPGGLERPRVCTGPVCEMRGSGALIEALAAAGHDPEPMPCPGRCDQPVPVIRGASVLGWTGRLFPRALPSAESPAAVRGLVSFSGSGAVYLHAT